VEKTIVLPSLPYSQVGSTYILLSMPEEGNVTGSFSAVLKFQVRDVDPTSGEPESDDFYDDTYAVSLKLANYIRRL
jgi:coatomer protein complex subunit gamma